MLIVTDRVRARVRGGLAPARRPELATAERLHLGRALIPTGAQMWVDEDGLHTGQTPNPRASALVVASTDPPLLLRQPFVGAAVFTGPDDPTGQHILGLSTVDAIVLLHTAARTHASGTRAPRNASEGTRGGSDDHRA